MLWSWLWLFFSLSFWPAFSVLWELMYLALDSGSHITFCKALLIGYNPEETLGHSWTLFSTGQLTQCDVMSGFFFLF